jgi:hypothetical protein
VFSVGQEPHFENSSRQFFCVFVFGFSLFFFFQSVFKHVQLHVQRSGFKLIGLNPSVAKAKLFSSPSIQNIQNFAPLSQAPASMHSVAFTIILPLCEAVYYRSEGRGFDSR